MNISRSFSVLLAATILAVTNPIFAEVLTPPSNLAGLKTLKERIGVELNLKGADEFGVEASEVVKRVRSTLDVTDLSFEKSTLSTPSLTVDIKGESAGNGGASFSVELVVRALIPSPLLADRSTDAILWRKLIANYHVARYDPAAKALIRPTGTLSDRVYETVIEVTRLLVADLKLVKE